MKEVQIVIHTHQSLMSSEDIPLNASTTDEDEKLTIKAMWSRSLVFKVVLIACAVFALAFVVTILVSIKTSSSQSSEIESLTSSYNECQATQQKQSEEISSLEEKLANATEYVDTLKKENTDLLLANGKLQKDLEDTTTQLNKTKAKMKYWQIGTGVGGGLTLAAGGIAVYEGFLIKSCPNELKTCTKNLEEALEKVEKKDKEITSLKQAIELLNKEVIDLESTIDSLKEELGKMYTRGMAMTNKALDALMLKRMGKSVSMQSCYDSEEGTFSQSEFKEGCGSSGSTLIVLMTAKTQFGVFIKENLPEEVDVGVTDNNAFAHILNRLVYGEIKQDKVAFKYPSDGMLDIGDGEILVSESTNGSTTVKVSEGKTFNIEDSYNEGATEFQVTRIIGYKVTSPQLKQQYYASECLLYSDNRVQLY
eukprot:TRINITY_DN105050_c0_g1_i1.p1 TRINITY_DN105050_c0_g1~~TRINITY_DN105050_c0_g1_i1.p1  ORF type:complete len:477 (+),score=52.72 TRINITY_DN105050_c0_g1_i1:168-1433(+)